MVVRTSAGFVVVVILSQRGRIDESHLPQKRHSSVDRRQVQFGDLSDSQLIDLSRAKVGVLLDHAQNEFSLAGNPLPGGPHAPR